MALRAIQILYVIDSLPRGGGTESQLAGLIERLDRRRFRPHLCTLRPAADPLRPADCPHLAFAAPRLGHPRGVAAWLRLAGYLRRRRIDAVQAYFQDATLFGATAARAAGVPVRLGALRDLGFWRTPRQEAALRRVHPLLTGFIANSEAVRAHFCRRDGLDPARVAVIPNGLDVAALPFRDHDEAPVQVGIVGNLNREVKRTDLFLEAAGRLALGHPGVVWHVVGDGALRPRYEACAAELGLGGRVIFAGRVADVPAYLERLAIGVICSDSEGFSNAVLEYMLRGCAVVATDVGGNREAVRHGETGLLVPPGDATALAAALGRLLAEPETRRTLARRARAEAAAKYDWARCVAAHQEHYEAALRAARRR